MAWYNSSWLYRQKITINHTKVPGDLTSFPVLITADNIKSAFWGHVKSDGSDIVLTANDGTTKLYRELVQIDTTWQRLELWVNTSLLSATDVDLYIYYGNAAGAEVNDANTWDSNFKLVHHMNDNPDISNISDSTINNNDGIKKGSNEPAETSGKWHPNGGKAQNFDGVDDYINCGHNASIADFNTFTTEFWFERYSAGENNAGRLTKKMDRYWTNVSGQFYCEMQRWSGDEGEWRTASSIIIDYTWHHIVIRYNYGSTANDPVVMIDGIIVSLTEVTTPTDPYGVYSDAADDFFIGDDSDHTRSFDGIIDEVRYSNIIRSDNWVITCYNNQNDPASFYSISDEETSGSVVFVTVQPTGGTPGIGKIMYDNVNKHYLWQIDKGVGFITKGWFDSIGYHDGAPS